VQLQLAAVRKGFGAQTVLDDVTFSVGPGSRIGLVGPNGAGKTTLLRLLAGLEEPDTGTVARSPERLRVGLLPQEPDAVPSESLLAHVRRRTGVAAAEDELQQAAAALARGEPASDRYSAALDTLVALGGGDLETRARVTSADLGLAVGLAEQDLGGLSGGERARASLAAILLSRFDVLLLDEPTNDLDLDGLDRLERFLDAFAGALVVVSHDRAFLDRVVTRIASIEPGTRRVREWAGGWSEYAAARDAERATAYDRYEQAQVRRKELAALLARRRNEARAGGAMADRRGTHALQTKVRQAERLLGRNEAPEKPFEPWELQLSLAAGELPGNLVVRLDGAVGERGSFRLGPIDLDVVPGERLVVSGRNGAGKSTLLAMLTGDLPLVRGHRSVGRRTTIGVIGQGRPSYDGVTTLLDTFVARAGLVYVEARTLLAKFGLGAEHVDRPCLSLSPGERTRAHLAELQARDVNLLVLDEPTNHLDLEAVEQLETALAWFDGTLIVVSHDRAFLEAVQPTRSVAL
jgi:ATPase subunit of ABC transporter with duplicated ATPase domains